MTSAYCRSYQIMALVSLYATRFLSVVSVARAFTERVKVTGVESPHCSCGNLLAAVACGFMPGTPAFLSLLPINLPSLTQPDHSVRSC